MLKSQEISCVVGSKLSYQSAKLSIANRNRQKVRKTSKLDNPDNVRIFRTKARRTLKENRHTSAVILFLY